LYLAGSGQYFVVRVGPGQPPLGLENFPLKIPNFSIFFPSDQKNLIWLVQKIPGSKTHWPLIYTAAGQKYARGWARAHLYKYIAKRILFWRETQSISWNQFWTSLHQQNFNLYFYSFYSAACKSGSFKAHFFGCPFFFSVVSLTSDRSLTRVAGI